MSAPQVQAIDLDLIDVGDRIRRVDMEQAENLAASMKERGQLQPIKLRPIAQGRYKLTIGAHRYTAAQINGWTKINAYVADASDQEARLDEIDENLFRHELNPFDQANFMEERRRLWEQLYGDVKRGGDRRSKGQIVPLIDEVRRGTSFYKETAQKFKINPKTIKRALLRKAHIEPTLWAALADTEAATNAAILDKIRKLTREEQQEVAVELRGGRKIKEAIKIVVASGATEEDLSARRLQAIEKAWAAATEDERKQFLASIKGKK